jgi:hypothetical protein
MYVGQRRANIRHGTYLALNFFFFYCRVLPACLIPVCVVPGSRDLSIQCSRFRRTYGLPNYAERCTRNRPVVLLVQYRPSSEKAGGSPWRTRQSLATGSKAGLEGYPLPAVLNSSFFTKREKQYRYYLA